MYDSGLPVTTTILFYCVNDNVLLEHDGLHLVLHLAGTEELELGL